MASYLKSLKHSYLEAHDALRNRHPTTVDGFHFISPKIGFRCSSAYPTNPEWWVLCAIFSEMGSDLEPLLDWPLIFIKLETEKNIEHKMQPTNPNGVT